LQSYRQQSFVKPFRLFLLPLLIGVAGSTHAALRPASTEDIVNATIACVAISERAPTDAAVAKTLGWHPAAASGKDGQPIDMGMTILGHSNNRSLLMVVEGNCSVTAGLNEVADFAATLTHLRTHVAPEKEVPQDGGVVMIKGQQIFLIRPTGSRKSPSIAITTMLRRQAPQ
jgi:hypothetical protein